MIIMKSIFILSLAALLNAALCSAQPGGMGAPVGTAPQNGGGFGGFQPDLSRLHFSEKFTDINYAGDDQAYHTCDIYLPEKKQDNYPVVIHIYGSAWFSNNSKGMADLGTICAAYLEAGYAVVTPNHRASTDAKWPAQIHDIKAVIRFVRGEAEKYHFDTSFIAASGFSSGGHLASMAAVTSGLKATKIGNYEIDLEGSLGSYTGQSSAVNAACDWSGPVDLMHMDCGEGMKMPVSPEETLLGVPMAGNEDHYKSLSAPTYVNANTPPIIITHGVKDNVVPCCVGTMFYDVLQKAGVPSELNVVEEGGHGFNMYSDENLARAVAFLNKYRRAKAPAPESARSSHPWIAVTSPVVNPDNTVTFNYQNKNAKDVKVNVQFAGTQQMTLTDGGVWTVTLGPAAPDMYPYCFIVDGITIMDPSNPDWFPNEGFKNSIVDIRGSEPLAHSVQNVPHGSVDYVNYWSETLGTYANAIVYTPPFYDRNPKKKYPVFYLISGTTDTEEVYFKVGRMNFIMDNLIAEGRAKEMIIVLPYGNPSALLPPDRRSPFDFTLFSKDFTDDLMPFVEKNYRTINKPQARAIGGFSRGGNQALSMGLTHLDKFSWLCSYSSFTSMDLPGVYDDAAGLNKKINLFWLGVGTDDFLYGNAKEYMDFLDAGGIENVKVFTDDKFGHTWMNAKYFLTESLPLLFNK